jgi:hypothetical protein
VTKTLRLFGNELLVMLNKAIIQSISFSTVPADKEFVEPLLTAGIHHKNVRNSRTRRTAHLQGGSKKTVTFFFFLFLGKG